MKIGIFAPFLSPAATPATIGEFGRRAEQMGCESLWLGEHVVLFDEMEFPYPASPDGRIPIPEGAGFLESMTTLGFLAASTKTIRLGTGIALISQRHPVYTAKEMATLDWLSAGRMDFGVGVGWCKEEVIACGYTWQDRGKRADEFLEITRALWTQEVTAFSGKYFDIPPCRMDPKPVQKPHVPIVVGGHSAPAFRRAARFGAGWYGFALPPKWTARMIAGLDAALADAGRKRGADFEISVTPPGAVSMELAKEYADLGVDRLVVNLGVEEPQNMLRQLDDIEQLVDQV